MNQRTTNFTANLWSKGLRLYECQIKTRRVTLNSLSREKFWEYGFIFGNLLAYTIIGHVHMNIH